MRSMMMKMAAGTMLAGTMALGGTNAFADHWETCEPPRLASIQLLHEHHGAHHLIGNELISLNTTGTGHNDHLTFEVRGLDQWGRPLPGFEFHPTLSFPAGTALGWIEALGNNHFRFWAGTVEACSVPLWIQALENPAVSARLLVTIVAGWRAQAVEPHDGGYVPAPPVYVAPAPVYYAPAPTCAPAPRYPTGGVWFGQRSRSGGFWFGVDSNGSFSFGVRGR